MEDSNIKILWLIGYKEEFKNLHRSNLLQKRVFRMANRATIKVTAEISKMLTIYDASASKSNSAPSLRNFLHNGRSL